MATPTGVLPQQPHLSIFCEYAAWHPRKLNYFGVASRPVTWLQHMFTLSLLSLPRCNNLASTLLPQASGPQACAPAWTTGTSAPWAGSCRHAFTGRLSTRCAPWYQFLFLLLGVVGVLFPWRSGTWQQLEGRLGRPSLQIGTRRSP